ncbi:MAG: tRNA (guanosine(46)-N(7))-methyltransferase TrmB [Hyphomicrobiales bacterium]
MQGLERHRLDLAEPCKEPLKLFGRPVERLALEIGFGAGEHLLHQLGRQSTTGFIGCEPFVNGMAKLLDEAQSHDGRDRLRVHEGDARDVLTWLPDGCLDQVYLLYPDPWPKQRHEKRRFMGVDTLELMFAKMRPDAELRVASDIDAYKATTLKAVAQHKGFRQDESHDSAEPWADWKRTRYEAKAIKAGRIPAYFSFFRKLLPD